LGYSSEVDRFNRYIAARDRALETLRLENGIAAGHAWASFFSMFTGAVTRNLCSSEAGRLFNRYIAARARADETRRLEDRLAADHAWARFLEAFTLGGRRNHVARAMADLQSRKAQWMNNPDSL
jgi:hypothetical protein